MQNTNAAQNTLRRNTVSRLPKRARNDNLAVSPPSKRAREESKESNSNELFYNEGSLIAFSNYWTTCGKPPLSLTQKKLLVDFIRFIMFVADSNLNDVGIIIIEFYRNKKYVQTTPTFDHKKLLFVFINFTLSLPGSDPPNTVSNASQTLVVPLETSGWHRTCTHHRWQDRLCTIERRTTRWVFTFILSKFDQFSFRFSDRRDQGN